MEIEGIVVGKTYTNPANHKRKVMGIEQHFGTVQIRAYDAFYAKTVWESVPEFRAWMIGKTNKEIMDQARAAAKPKTEKAAIRTTMPR